MSTPKDDGRAAFPRAAAFSVQDDMVEPQTGMSLRDWFAGQALQSMVAHVAFPQFVEDQLHKAGVKTEDFEAWTAHVAYSFADAMLAARKETT